MKPLVPALLLGLSPLVPLASGPTTPGTSALRAGEYEVDAVHSSVVFKTLHVGVSNFYGRFNKVEGTVGYDPEDPSAGFVRVQIDAESVDTANEGRDRHLRNNDFFSVKEFPVIVFESTAVEADGEDLAVTGQLTFHGVTKEITADVDVIGSGEAMGAHRAGFEATFTIDMRDFGISMVEKNPGAVGPEVELIVSLETIRG